MDKLIAELRELAGVQCWASDHLANAANALESQAREIERLGIMVSQADYNYDCDRAQWKRELAALKAQSGGVVLPERRGESDNPAELMFNRGHDHALSEVARLNQPASAGDERASRVNDWFLSLPPERQAVLRDDKWLLADAAFIAGQGRSALSANHSEQVRGMVLEGLTVERDVFGTIHIKSGDFDFIQIRYQYPYTDNAGTWRLAERIVALLAGPSAPSHSEQVREDTRLLDWLEENLADTIYLDDGRIVDIAGRRTVREAIREAAATPSAGSQKERGQ